MTNRDLSTFFTAKTIGVVGASNQFGKVGYDVVNNLKQFGYPGTIIPINPKSDEIQGLKAYKRLSDYPEPIELVFIAVPTKYVNSVIDEMGELGIKYVVIITAGYKEIGAEGAKLEKELNSKLKEHGIRCIGPNVVGILDAHTPLNGSFASRMPLKGNLGFISQSGALITGILDWSMAENMGFSKFISVGNKIDIDETDLIEYLGEDKQTHAIMAYLESINKGPQFIEACRKVSQIKPIIVIKSGSSSAGARAASSHTGSMAGTNTAYDAAFEKAGVIRADSIQELFDSATAFSTQPLPASNRVCIITNAGGPGIIATDASEFAGLELANLSTSSMDELRKVLPPAASVYNPIDVLGTGMAKEYDESMKIAMADDNVDMILIIMTPQGMTEPVKTAQAIISNHKKYPTKPIAAAYMGGVDLEQGTKLLKENGIPCFTFPERGIHSLMGLYKYSQIRKMKLQEDIPLELEVDRETVNEIIESVINKGRINMLGSEAIAVAKAYGINTPQTKTCFTVNEAIKAATDIGFPIVMKITSPDIIHKTDIKGVVIGVKDADEVKFEFTRMMNAARQYYPDSRVIGVDIQEMSKVGREIILGTSQDPQFGHLIMIGSGGVYANYVKDIQFGLAPLSVREAKTMFSKTKIHKILEGVRGENPSDISATIDTLLRISQLVTDFPEILELDINPLFVFDKGEGVSAVDVKITLDRDLVMERFK
ncbi:MAG: acetate--CoA ligase family protein [Candidatus Heimdallarchaeota archaeon]|nr:acetate--CoA ligase family protein [Candidatus Heimdallarchaeota archaeon]